MATPVSRYLLSPVWAELTPDEQQRTLQLLSVFQEQLHTWQVQYQQDRSDMIAAAQSVIDDIVAENATLPVPQWLRQLGYQVPLYLSFVNPRQWTSWHPQVEIDPGMLAHDQDTAGMVIPGRWTEMVTNYQELATELLTLAESIQKGLISRQDELMQVIYSSRLSDNAKLLIGRINKGMYPQVQANRKVMLALPALEGQLAQTIAEQAAAIAEVNHLTRQQLADLDQTVHSQMKQMTINLERQFRSLTAKKNLALQFARTIQHHAQRSIQPAPGAVDPLVTVLVDLPVEHEAVIVQPALAPTPEATSPVAPVSSDEPEQVNHPAVGTPPPATADDTEKTLSPQVETLKLQFIGSSVVSNWYRNR